MSGPVVTVGAAVLCMHGGPASIMPGSPRVMLSGMPAATTADQFLVAGCAFQLPPPTPHPCMLVNWLVPATRVFVNGTPVITQGSVGLSVAADQTPQGPATVVGTQPRVVAT